MINESSLWAAVHRIEAATVKAERAASEMEEAARRIAFLLEPGYGGNGLRLIELLERVETSVATQAQAEIPSSK